MGKGLLLKKVMVNSNSNKSELRREMKVRRKELAAVEKTAADARVVRREASWSSCQRIPTRFCVFRGIRAISGIILAC